MTTKPADLGSNGKVESYLEGLMSGFMRMRREIWPKLEAEATEIRKVGHLRAPGSDPLPGYVCMGGTLIRRGPP